MDFLKIDSDSYTPVYIQIQDGIKHAIESGVLKPGQQLPSIREFAGTVGLNPNTVAKALKNLVIHGVLISRQGLGCFVATQQPDDGGAESSVQNIPGYPRRDSSNRHPTSLVSDPQSGKQLADTKTPTYIRIRNDFLSRILDRSLPPGSALPTLREIASQYNVTANTAMSALNELKQRGYIRSARGIGYQVNDIGHPQPKMPDAVSPSESEDESNPWDDEAR